MVDLEEEQQKRYGRADIKQCLRPIIEAGKCVWSVLPARLTRRRPRFSFILAHYCYILSMTITISIMLYPANQMPYIDALFFATGVATQSGLSTIDVNLLNTYQQLVIMLMTCICTPICINIAVVFIRLYWFEKRFKHIVKGIRSWKRSKARSIISRSKSQAKQGKDDKGEDDDSSRLEMGVRGRRSTMMHYNPNLGGMDGAPENESTARRELVDELRMNNIFESVNPTPGASRSDSTDRKGETVSDETTVRNPSTPPKIPQRTHSPTPIPTPTPDLPQTPGVFF